MSINSNKRQATNWENIYYSIPEEYYMFGSKPDSQIVLWKEDPGQSTLRPFFVSLMSYERTCSHANLHSYTRTHACIHKGSQLCLLGELCFPLSQDLGRKVVFPLPSPQAVLIVQTLSPSRWWVLQRRNARQVKSWILWSLQPLWEVADSIRKLKHGGASAC